MAAVWVGIYSIFLFLQNFLNIVNGYIENILSEKINIYTTNRIMCDMTKLPMEYFDESLNYDKIQKVNSESNVRSMSIIKTLVNLIQSIITLTGTIIILLQISWEILVILFLVCVPTLVLSLNIAFEQYNVYNKRVKDIACPVALIFGVQLFNVAWPCRQRPPRFTNQLIWLFVHADNGGVRVIRHGIYMQDIFHTGDEFSVFLWLNAPIFVQPWLEFKVILY